MSRKTRKALSSMRLASIRGKQSEEKTRIALSQLFREKIVSAFRQSIRGSRDDLMGIDFLVTVKSLDGLPINFPLQVKSSEVGIQKHNLKANEVGVLIQAVNGQDPNLKQQIIEIIHMYQGINKAIEKEEDNTMSVNESTQISLIPEVQQQPEVIFEIKDGKVWVSSLEIARLFEREHHNVLKAIKNLETDANFAHVNFYAGTYRDANNQERSMFMMTKKGYRRLVMDFTGKKASEVKEQLLDRFEELEEKEKNPPLALSGDFGALLIQAGEQIQKQNLVITQLNQEKGALHEIAEKLATENITVNTLLDDSQLIGLREAAKIFRLFGDDPKPKIVINAMRELKWIYKQGKDSPNLPYAKYEAHGYMRTICPKIGNEEREQVKFTPKGLLWAYPQLCTHFHVPFKEQVKTYIQSLIDKWFGDTPPAA